MTIAGTSCTGVSSQMADASGAFSCTFLVPSGTSGTTVTATDVGGQSATGTFTVTVPTISVTPTQGPDGAAYTVTGSGFSVSSGVTVWFNSVAQTPTGGSDCTYATTAITSDSSGGFVCTFAVPSVSSGSYPIQATDTASTDASNTVTFTVTTPAITVTPVRGQSGRR